MIGALIVLKFISNVKAFSMCNSFACNVIFATLIVDVFRYDLLVADSDLCLEVWRIWMEV
jgi:hypothetical protein